jgi:hypothetical protein
VSAMELKQTMCSRSRSDFHSGNAYQNPPKLLSLKEHCRLLMVGLRSVLQKAADSRAPIGCKPISISWITKMIALNCSVGTFCEQLKRLRDIVCTNDSLSSIWPYRAPMWVSGQRFSHICRCISVSVAARFSTRSTTHRTHPRHPFHLSHLQGYHNTL